MCDLTQFTVRDLLGLLECDNQIAWDAMTKVLPLILEQAMRFHGSQGEFATRTALEIASMFVTDDMDAEDAKAIIRNIVSLARYLLRVFPQFELTSEETHAQLKRIAESGQPSEPTEPTTTAPAPVEAERSVRSRMRSRNDGAGAEASHA
jgi:hypothetical protein